jgi:hypothetical protein
MRYPARVQPFAVFTHTSVHTHSLGEAVLPRPDERPHPLPSDAPGRR